MVSITYYHNPRCSKSRQGLALFEERGATLQLRHYLDEPLAITELEALAKRLEGPFESLVRTNETVWKALNIAIDDQARVLDALAAESRLLQRPIADDGKRAIIGRPPEAMLTLLDSAN